MSERDPVSAYDVGHDHGDGYSFAIDEKKVAEALRHLADRIDKGQAVAVQKFTVLSVARHAEYTLTFLRMSFHERAIEQEAS